MLQDRARREAQEERAREGTRPAREVGGEGRGRRGAEEEEENEDENAIKKGRNNQFGERSAVGKRSQDALPSAAKVKWAVIGRRRCCLIR